MARYAVPLDMADTLLPALNAGVGLSFKAQAIALCVLPRDACIPLDVAELDCYSPLEWSMGRIGRLDECKKEYIGRLISETLEGK